MDKSKFYYENGNEFYGIFREIPMGGTNNAVGEIPPPSYTIKEEDDDLPSAHRIYMESMNEYDAAKKLVPSWAYWKNMLKFSAKIRRLVEGWREEHMLRDQIRAKELLWQLAEKGNVSAQKLLYETKREEYQQRVSRAKAAQEDRRQQDMAEAVITRLKAVK